MKSLIYFIVLLFCSSVLKAQVKIPESIKTDLTLKPMPKPYESTGFTLEKGVTLTIMAGVKINMSVKAGEKANFPIIDFNGKLKVGGKGSGKSAPVIFEGTAPMFRFNSANLEINGIESNVYCVRFFGDNQGYVNNCSFINVIHTNSNYDFTFTVPKSGNLSFQNCLIEGQGIELKTNDFPNDIANLTILNCAFTTIISKSNAKKLAQHFMPIMMFAYGTKCDFYLDIEFKPFNWEFKKPYATEWYIGDERLRKMVEDSVKPNKTFAMKFPTKPFTNYKQVEVLTEKDKEAKK